MTTTRERALEAALRNCLAGYEQLGDNTFKAGWRFHKTELKDWHAALAPPPDPAPDAKAQPVGAHTPGPWVIKYVGKAAAPKIVRNLDGAPITPPLAHNTLQAWPNARLIAAAPDMLAALQTVLRMIEGENLDEAHGDEAEEVRAAIARATGTEG